MKHAYKVIVLLILINVFSFTLSNKEIYTDQYDGIYWEKKFDKSQYSMGDKGDYILSDAELNAYRGYLYVVKGVDLEKFLPGHPPLASYFMGISIKLFGNPVIPSVFFGLVSLYFIYKIAELIFNDKFTSSITTLLVSLEPLFKNQLNDSMLDVYMLCFGVIAVYSFIKWIYGSNVSPLLLSQLFVGFTLSTKFFLNSIPLFFALLSTVVFLNRFSKFKEYVITIPLIGIGYAIGHLTYFLHHLSLVDFAKYQRYVLSWWFGSPQTEPFGVWDLILFNKWHTWWGSRDVVGVSEWTITWPVIFIVGMLTIITILKNRKGKTFFGILPIYFWFLFSMVLFSFEAVYPRHLFFVLPAAYILSTYSLKYFVIPKIYTKNR